MKKEIINNKKGEIVIYQVSKNETKIEVKLEQETAWLSLNQIASLFETDKSGISRHIRNIFKSNELNKNSTVAKIATVQTEGKRKITRHIEYCNLDLILSVGYRVNSKRATQFRIWATRILKEHLVKGYTINEKRLLEAKEKFDELQNTITFLQEKSKKELLSGQAQGILSLLSIYAKTLTLLEEYDKGKIGEPKGKKAKFILKYEDCQNIVKSLKKELVAKKEAGDLFGLERQNSFEGIVKNLYQTFDGQELYPAIEDKASHLLYLTIKDHPFSDGNKRTASFLFVYFLDKSNYLYKKSGEKKINDNALTALALLVAESEPKEKEVMIKIIKNMLKE